MAPRQEIAAVYAGAVIQGVALVTFPAVSAIFTSPAHFNLSSTEYGGIFVPQAATAILSSLLGAGLTRRIGGKGVLLLGLGADLLAMALLFASQFVATEHTVAYLLLLTATTFMGIGFGFVVPSLNTFTAAFFPQRIDNAILTLNALLGLGTALAPVFAAIFVGFGIWWGLPLLVGVGILALIVFASRLPLREEEAPPAIAAHPRTAIRFPARFWIYAAFALLYGICETMSGNWASLYMTNGLGASTTLASLALTLFWVMVTVGRILFAAVEHWFPERLTYRLLPLVIITAFIATAFVPASHPIFGLFCFALAGLGCSALLPLVISFGQGELTTMSAAVAGGMIGFYQMGYGLAAFGVGPLQTWAGLGLGQIFGWMAIPALALAVLAFIIVQRHQPEILREKIS